MSIRFNFNICDNSPECSGLSVCPVEAIYWDADGVNALGEKGVLCIDNDKCINCGKCVGEDGCPVGAIIFAQTEEELEKLAQSTEINVQKVKSLFVERYGAEPIDETICIDAGEVADHLGRTMTIIEEFTESSIQCLLNSIPVAQIVKKVVELIGTDDIQYYKCDYTGQRNTESPVLKLYKGNDLIAQIDGYYENSRADELYKKIEKAIM